MNTSAVNVTLILTAYGTPGPLNYGAFFLTFVLYAATVFSNLTLMLVIYFDPSLHKPMYIFLFNLAVNGLIGSSAVCPSIMKSLLSDVNTISLRLCLLQVFFTSVYGSCAYAVLTVMAIDRYVSICKPLLYHVMMTPTKIRIILCVVYIFPVSSLALNVYFTSRLPMCGFKLNKLFCDNLAIVNLACERTELGNFYGICLVFVSGLIPFLLVILSYVKILTVCLKATGSMQKKALSTCAPHLITFINLTAATFFSVIYNRLSHYVSNEVNVVISLYYVFVPPLLHPLIYGIRTREISQSILKVIQKRSF